MFATPTSYCVTPGRSASPFSRLPSRASSIIRDVKRRSLRSYRRGSKGEHKENRLSGTFLQLAEEGKSTTNNSGPTPCKECWREQRTGSQQHLPLRIELSDCEDKENLVPEAGHKVPRITRTQSLRRRCSNYFTPKTKRTASSITERTASMRLPSSQRLTEMRRPSISSSKHSPKTSSVSGAGRLIPIKQGYMYKRSGTSRLYRRKYVTLCTDSVLTYWPSFQAYMDNVEGKEIQLSHVTVKVPGRPPTGVRTTTGEDDEERSSAGSGDVSLEELDEEQQAGVELVLVSLDSTTWQFQVCSPRELRQWEEAIQAEIHASLTRREVKPDLDRVRGFPGNNECADCRAKHPDWASLNLGILVCIECSGIHRNLGSHISKVRSLSLDSWPQTNLSALERNGGNFLVNSCWEARLGQRSSTRPRPTSSRTEKEEFIRAKYVLRAFCSPTSASSHGVLI